jgi:hypothetical protein
MMSVVNIVNNRMGQAEAARIVLIRMEKFVWGVVLKITAG